MDRARALFDLLGSKHLNTPLAAALGVPRMRLSRWRRGPTRPSPEQCDVIADFVAEQAYPGRARERNALRADLLAWVRGDAMDPDDEAKVLRLLRRQIGDPQNEVAELRRERGLAAKEAAARLGVSRQTLHTWEHTPATPERLATCRAAWGEETPRADLKTRRGETET